MGKIAVGFGLALALLAAPAFDDLAARARAAREGDRTDEAIRLYREGVRLRPRWDEGWWYLATLLYGKNADADAARAFARAAAIKPENSSAWLLLGHCEFLQKQFDQALPHLLKGLEDTTHVTPEVIGIGRYHAALLFNLLGEHEDAMRQILPLVGTGDRSARVVEAIGMCALRKTVLPEQIAQEDRAVVAAVGEAVWALTAREPDAGARYEKLVATFGGRPNVHYAYGVYLSVVDPEAAVAQFEKELEGSPRHVWARLQIANLRLDSGDLEPALRYAREAVRLAPKVFLTHLALGRALLRSGEVVKSIPELEQAVALAPERRESRASLMQAYTRVGREADAARQREYLGRNAPGAR